MKISASLSTLSPETDQGHSAASVCDSELSRGKWIWGMVQQCKGQCFFFFFMFQFFIKDYSKHFPLVTAYTCTAHVWRISWNFCPYHVWTCGSRSHHIPHQFDLSCIDKLQSNVIFAHTCQLLGQFQMFCLRDIMYSRIGTESIKICCCRRQFGRWVLERFKILSRWLFDCQSLTLNVRNSQLGPRFIKLIWSGNKLKNIEN